MPSAFRSMPPLVAPDAARTLRGFMCSGRRGCHGNRVRPGARGGANHTLGHPPYSLAVSEHALARGSRRLLCVAPWL